MSIMLGETDTSCRTYICIDELRTKLDCDRIIKLSFKRSIECIKCHIPLRDENLGSKLYAK